MLRKIVTWALVALAVAGVAVAITNRVTAPPTAPVAAEVAVALPDDGVVVTYFTTDVRCPGCRKIETLSEESVTTRFPGEFESGRVVFRVVNTDRPENKHFLDDYKLVSKTVIVSRHQGGKEQDWVNLQDVWLKLDDPAAFGSYIGDAVKRFLDAPAS